MTATDALIESTRRLVLPGVLQDDAREVARHCLLDFFACSIAGAGEPLVEILVETIAQGDASQASLIASSQRASALNAALINGAAGHALDFDDTHTTMTGHPSVPVLPALLAACELEPVPGGRLLEALIVGIELECRLGVLLGGAHYLKGFHGTATLGTFGAAAACAHLLGLDDLQWRHAIGLAGTQAAGLKASFGSMAKPLHAGKAASSGLLAALLARGGFTGSQTVLEAPQGFAVTQADGPIDDSALDRYRDEFLIRQTLFKVHAACYLTHATIEAVHRLRSSSPLEVDRVRAVEVHVAPMVLDVCNIQEPTTGLEGKFSLRANFALAVLQEDTTDPAIYRDEKMADPRLIAWRDLVRVETDPALAGTASRVVIDGADGRLEETVDTGVPEADLHRQRERLLAKFAMLVDPVLGSEGSGRLATAILAMDQDGNPAELLAMSRGK